MAIVRTGKDRRPRGPNGSRVGRDTRSYTAISELGTGENGERLRKWKSFPTQREAKAWVAQTIGEVNKGTYVEPTKQTVREFAREWIEAIRPSLKQSTASSYESVIRLYILPAMGGVRLASVTPEMVGKLYSSVQAQGLSSRTARYAGQILKTLLGSAVREGKLPRSPAEYVKPPRHQPVRELGTWDGQELTRFLRAAKTSHLFPAFRLAATTGMRRAEIAGLRWGDVDLSEGRVSVRHARVMSGGRVVDTTPKTGRSVRMISLDKETAEVLREHKLGQMQLRYPEDLRAEDDVFSNWRGGRLSPETLSYEFEKVAATIPGLPYLTLHGLRHTWATLALRAGIHVKVVSERLGHSNIGVTLNTYSHAIPAMEAEAAEKVAALLKDVVKTA